MIKLLIKESEDREIEQFFELDSKQVKDYDGFLTDYTMYLRVRTTPSRWIEYLKSQDAKKGILWDDFDTSYVFVFGDKELYEPEDGDFDYECDSEAEADEWFDSYNGFEDDEEDW